MPGRHPTPLPIAELRGRTKRNPGRYKTRQAKSNLPVGTAPDHLSEAAKLVWLEIESHAIAGVLTAPHRLLLEMTANLVAEYRVDPAAFPTPRVAQLRGALASLGLTPVDQQRLGLEKPEAEESPWARLAQRAGNGRTQ